MIKCEKRQPSLSGVYKVRCGVTLEDFYAKWVATKGCWFDTEDSEPIIFGNRNMPGDMWEDNEYGPRLYSVRIIDEKKFSDNLPLIIQEIKAAKPYLAYIEAVNEAKGVDKIKHHHPAFWWSRFPKILEVKEYYQHETSTEKQDQDAKRYENYLRLQREGAAGDTVAAVEFCRLSLEYNPNIASV